MNFPVAAFTSQDAVLYGAAILFSFVAMLAIFILTYWFKGKSASISPYSGMPLRRADDLSYDSKVKVLRFLYNLSEYDNRIFEFRTSSFCRETGRIFPKSVTFFDTIHVDWTFLQKRYPGNWVSWGSLSELQQEHIREAHHSLAGFQTHWSSPTPSPRAIEKEYAMEKPGPLYVDLDTKILLGWKEVPDSSLEILIVQKPKGIFETPNR